MSGKDWIATQWPSHIFFDPRIHKRALHVAAACLNFPHYSIPKRFASAGDAKGFYRLMRRTDMGHERLQSAHCDNVREEASTVKGRVPFIQDGSELLFNSHPWTLGLGPTADASGPGIMLHSCITVECGSEHPRMIGLAGQKAWIRQEEKSKDSEADIWLEMLQHIGSPPQGCVWTTVGDRGSDIFSFIEGLSKAGWDCVLRMTHDRTLRVHGTEKRLKSHMRSLPSMGQYAHHMRAKPGVCSKELTLQVSWAQAETMPPGTEKGKQPVMGSYVRVWHDEEPNLEWFLCTLTPNRICRRRH